MYAFLYISDFLGVIESCIGREKTIHKLEDKMIEKKNLRAAGIILTCYGA